MHSSFTIAQISDCHLFSQKHLEHCGANVHQNLSDILVHIRDVSQPDAIIFTGDLTQDHSEASYKNFADLFIEQKIEIPVYYVAGNHDEFDLLDHHLSGFPFCNSKTIQKQAWQILLVQSKGDTPSGMIDNSELQQLSTEINPKYHQLVMMHHHPIDVGYFIDKHGLKNKCDFWNVINQHPSIRAIACGHVHQAITLPPAQTGYSVPLYTCPATSIQFDTQRETSACNGQGGGYRVFKLFDDGQLDIQTTFMFNQSRDLLSD